MNKKVLTILTIVLIVLVLGAGVFAYVYFGTDILKSNQQLFEKYYSNYGKNISTFFSDSSLEAYLDKEKSTPFENTGSINIAADNDKINYDLVKFNGKVDNTNSKLEENVYLQFSNTVSFPFTVVANENKYGITSNDVTTKYIAVENKELKQLAKNLGVSEDQLKYIPDSIDKTEIDKLMFTEDDINSIESVFATAINNNVTKDDYTSSDKNRGDITLTIAGDTYKNIDKEILTELKDNQTILNKLNELNNTDVIDEYQKSIDDELDDIDNEDYSNKYIKITVYKAADTIHIEETSSTLDIDLSSTELNIHTKDTSSSTNPDDLIKHTLDNSVISSYVESDTTASSATEYYIKINKEINNDNSTYKVIGSYVDKDSTIKDVFSFTAKYTGLTQNNVSEKYIFNVNDSDNNKNVTLTFSNDVTFKDSVNITTLDDTNSALINDYNSDELSSIATQLVQQVYTAVYTKAIAIQNDTGTTISTVISYFSND